MRLGLGLGLTREITLKVRTRLEFPQSRKSVTTQFSKEEVLFLCFKIIPPVNDSKHFLLNIKNYLISASSKHFLLTEHC